MLWSVLSGLGYSHMHPATTAQLIVSFANQLNHSGRWQWAVFVLLHLTDPTLSRFAVEETLNLNCSAQRELSSSESFVIEKLHVPKEWVYSAKAQVANYEGLYHLKAHHLLNAGRWNDAHDTIMEHLAVDEIISGMCIHVA